MFTRARVCLPKQFFVSSDKRVFSLVLLESFKGSLANIDTVNHTMPFSLSGLRLATII